ncbi:MAG: ABC transporter permease subunit [Trueperaceae bacterium]|nr:ABC transporter permease subunit [Trueperaceae bacterium]
MDISRSSKDFLAKRRRSEGSLWLSLLLLFIAISIAFLVGAAGVIVIRQFAPDAPAYFGILFGILALVLCLRFIAQRFEWIMPWYYLLPAILFLLTFTVFPVVLTIILAFTDYAGIRNGQLSVSTETQVVAVNDRELTLANATTLQCDQLMGSRAGCNDVRAVVYASGSFETTGVSLDDVVLTVDPPPPVDRAVQAVEINLPSVGFAAQFPVESVDGNRLTLGRVPPADADIKTLRLTLDRVPLERKIISVNGNTVTLDEPLPDDLGFEAIARYNDFGSVGFDNFRLIFNEASRALGPVFVWNIIFAFSTIFINTVIGVFIALLLNNPNLQFRNVYRTLLIVPWALPGIITIQVWRGFLNENFGAINRLLALLDLPTFDWLGSQAFAALAPKSAILLVNLWLGLPFMMTAVLGALSAIPRELYEAARVDGATAWQGFWGVTAPLLRTALIPITLTGFAFNFNNFNLIYLLTQGGPACPGSTATARCTDILISWAYNEAFQSQGGYAYGLGSAISIIIFIITLAISLINFRVTGALKEEPNT